MSVDLQKVNGILTKFKKVSTHCFGEYTIDLNKAIEHITPAKKSYDTNILKDDPAKAEVLSKYLKKLDEIIAKNPTNLELRKYKATIEKLKK